MINADNKKGIIAFGIILIIIILTYVFLGRPLFVSTIQNYKDIKDKKSQLDAEKKEIDEITSLEKEMSDLKPTMDKIQNYLPEKEEMGSLITSIEGAAINSGNTIQSIEFKQTTQDQTSSAPSEETSPSSQRSSGQTSSQTSGQGGQSQVTLPQISGTQNKDFELILNGNFASLQQFLINLENFPRFVNVASIEIEGKSDTGALQIKIRLYTYFRSQ